METDIISLPESIERAPERLASWLDSIDGISILLALVFVIIVYLARNWIARQILSLFSIFLNRLSVGLSETISKELTTTTAVLVVVLALFPVLEALNLAEFIGDFATKILVSVAIISVFAGWYSLCGPLVSLLHNNRFDRVRMEAGWMERAAEFAVILFGITAVLKVWQVDIGSALTGVVVLGAAIAFAAQDLISNLIGGMNNMSEKRFAVGDSIQIDGVLVGTVEKIDLRSTLVRGFDQIPRYVPNSELSNAVVLNFSHRTNRRVMLSIPLILSSTPTQITAVRDALRSHLLESGDFEISDDAPQHVYVEGLSESAVPLIFYAWTTIPEYDNFLQVSERLTLKILEAVQQAGTELAYPTQTLEFADKPATPEKSSSSDS